MTAETLCDIDYMRMLLRDTPYDPQRGIGCQGRRVRVKTPVDGLPSAYIPDEMRGDSGYKAARSDSVAWRRLRCRYDFEYWASECVTVKDKQSYRDIAFWLNAPQRRVLQVLEEDRLAGRPMRIILLKARQWGGSTLVQMYMAWIQCVHRRNWNSVICAHVKDTSLNIRGMYTKMLEAYPRELWEGDEEPSFKPYERSGGVRCITGRGCRVTIGSSECPDSVRGADYAMAHLSETAFWRSSPTRSPRAVIQAVCGSIALVPYSFVAIESTACGTGDYFHTEWLRSKGGDGDKHAVFVPWAEIDFYRLGGDDAAEILTSLTEHERWLWVHGCASDNLRWYRSKRKEFESDEQFYAEFPPDDVLAFTSSQNMVFSSSAVERLREGCCDEQWRGDVSGDGSRFTEDIGGGLRVWEQPSRRGRYVVAVDVGGRSRTSDWSVIAVFDISGEKPRVVAQWRGHTDHDLLAAKSVAVARYYGDAFLIIESNTFETAQYGGSDSNLFVLNRISEQYNNLYTRRTFDTMSRSYSSRIGFHMNVSTKAMVIAGLVEAVRDGLYVERDAEACNELSVYEQSSSGAYSAKAGHHDDILMTRAIALHVIHAGDVPAPRLSSYPQRPTW